MRLCSRPLLAAPLIAMSSSSCLGRSVSRTGRESLSSPYRYQILASAVIGSSTQGRATLAIAGLLVVLLGQAIQISLDIGTHWALFDVGAAGVAVLNALKDLMTFGGAALAAWQVMLNS